MKCTYSVPSSSGLSRYRVYKCPFDGGTYDTLEVGASFVGDAIGMHKAIETARRERYSVIKNLKKGRRPATA
jgi:hypothetical protein